MLIWVKNNNEYYNHKIEFSFNVYQDFIVDLYYILPVKRFIFRNVEWHYLVGRAEYCLN